jgi:hypothetical protein
MNPMRAAIAINISAAQVKRTAISPWTIEKKRKRVFIFSTPLSCKRVIDAVFRKVLKSAAMG